MSTFFLFFIYIDWLYITRQFYNISKSKNEVRIKLPRKNFMKFNISYNIIPIKQPKEILIKTFNNFLSKP